MRKARNEILDFIFTHAPFIVLIVSVVGAFLILITNDPHAEIHSFQYEVIKEYSEKHPELKSVVKDFFENDSKITNKEFETIRVMVDTIEKREALGL